MDKVESTNRGALRIRPHVLGGLMLLLALAVVAACGGGDDVTKTAGPTNQQQSTTTAAAASQPGANAGSFDACSLLTKNEVEAALGESVQDPQSFSTGSQDVGPGVTVSVSACDYSSPTTVHSVNLSVWIGSDAITQAIDQLVCQQKDRLQGLGDVACWYDSSHDELQVAKGGAFLDITTSGATEGPIQTLAQKALDRLP